MVYRFHDSLPNNRKRAICEQISIKDRESKFQQNLTKRIIDRSWSTDPQAQVIVWYFVLQNPSINCLENVLDFGLLGLFKYINFIGLSSVLFILLQQVKLQHTYTIIHQIILRNRDAQALRTRIERDWVTVKSRI